MSTTTTGRSVPTSRTVEVDFLYLDLATCTRCRASDATLDAAVEAVRPALDPLGVGVEVRKTLVKTEGQARALGFVSSPTIRVNGRDIAGELVESSCSECGELCGCEEGVECRVWEYRGERQTEAPMGLIVEAILAEVGPPDGARGGEAPEATTSSADVSKNLKRFFAGTVATQNASSCCSAEE